MSSITERSFSLLTNLSSSLVSLHLSETELQGNLPRDILCLPKLEELDLSINYMLKGQLPKSNWSTHLRYLDLSGTSFSGEIPNSIGHLKYLNHLGFRGCNFDGMVPISLGNLTQLMYLSLGFNINLNDLSFNQLTGSVNEFSSYSLRRLSLYNNKLQGNFPNSIFELGNLTELALSSNNLSGPLDFHKFSKLKSLYYLDLSQNSFLSINFDSNIDYTLPNLASILLSSSNLSSFPQFLARLQNLQELDLSDNKINGKIPKWFHEKLLHSWKNMYHIDLSFNKLQGDLPIPPSGTQVFLVSNNNFSGEISSTLCDASSLNVLNLAHNNLTGLIPQCLGTFPSFWALDMQMNNFHGSMPTRFSKTNAFETIKLNGNRLQGPFPLSLAHCTNLEVLDLGNNNIEDTFPNWLESLQELQVLSLRSNKLHGKITCVSTKHPFPQLRIFDVSNNNFSGPLPASCIMNFQGMVNVNYTQSGPQYMGNSSYYDDSVVVIMKGQFMELERILTTFTTIDLSNNMFEGEIPKVIGKLNSLKGLNLSHNGITGSIPQSLSDLRNLEWLDLSWNQLTGEIPMALTNLNFLSVLNLSQNQLEGIIPKGRQFDTFGNDSYEGNPMLCGLPLSKSCNKDEGQPPHSTFHHEEESGFGWKSVAVGYACGAVFGMLMGCNVFLTGKPQWLARLVERLFNIRLKRTSNRARANRRGMN
ncbi:Leucine-rich repeat [Sesbania bispinosa]|nr:Leucine-rich repeat [Sesbania bispinosa]